MIITQCYNEDTILSLINIESYIRNREQTWQNSFFFPIEKERKFARKRGGGEKEIGDGGDGGRWCLAFFSKVL